MSVDGAKWLGEKLVAEVEVEDLSSVLKSLREFRFSIQRVEADEDPPFRSFFNIPALDKLFPSPTPPIIELVSSPLAHHPSGAGKTLLLYLMISHATLPSSLHSSIPLGGHGAAVIVFDPLHRFNVSRLAQTMLHLVFSKTGEDIDEATKITIRSIVAGSLLHVHIFRPQSWPSLLATLRSLPDYLFDKSRHKSIHRRIHSLILEDIDTFVCSMRKSNSSSLMVSSTTALATASTNITSAVQGLSTLLSCATILTSQSTTPLSFRPAIPTSWPQGQMVTRLAIRRVEVLKFAPAISIEEAEAERAHRWDVVQKGRFECWKVGAGVRDSEGFVFRIGQAGVEIEEVQGK